MKITKGSKSVIVLGTICFLWLSFMLAFRAFIYADMYKAPEDPYGISDILEFIMSIGFIILLALAMITSIVLIFRGMPQTRKFAAGLIVLCAILFFSFSPLLNIAARW